MYRETFRVEVFDLIQERCSNFSELPPSADSTDGKFTAVLQKFSFKFTGLCSDRNTQQTSNKQKKNLKETSYFISFHCNGTQKKVLQRKLIKKNNNLVVLLHTQSITVTYITELL